MPPTSRATNGYSGMYTADDGYRKRQRRERSGSGYREATRGDPALDDVAFRARSRTILGRRLQPDFDCRAANDAIDAAFSPSASATPGAMEIRIQVIVDNDERTRRDIARWERTSFASETLGLQIDEAEALLQASQEPMVSAQVNSHLAKQAA